MVAVRREVTPAAARVGRMTSPVLLVLGAGPGVGTAVARRFGRAGYDVALVARSPDRLSELGTTLRSEGITTGWASADLTDTGALTAAVERLGGHAGRIDVLHFNPSTFRESDPLSLTADDLLDDVRLGCASLLTALQAARPFLRAGARVIATGSMAADRPWHRAASLGVQKAALRNLVASVDATLAGDGIRAASVTVQGTLGATPDLEPERVADTLFAAAGRDDDAWTVEVSHPG
jgi:NADP-dependent 3-hydroxy acid dehydrogenase YdfG